MARLAQATPELSKYTEGVDIPHVLMSAPAGSMRAMLEILDEDGGLVAVLRAAGLTDDTVARLRARLVG